MSVVSVEAPSSRPIIRHLSLDGSHKKRLDKGRSRLIATMLAFGCVYAAIVGKLTLMALFPTEERTGSLRSMDDTLAIARPDVVDRNGVILATDVRQPSLYAEPKKIIDADEAAEQLAEIFPDLNAAEIRAKLTSGKGFVWIKREITPQQQRAVYALGIPGIGFKDENRRVYPSGRTTSHILGLVNIDNQGIAGLEKWVDGMRGLTVLRQAGFVTDRDQTPVELSIDLRVQHALRDELEDARNRYKAQAAAGVIMDANTGEIIALSSLPDFDPVDPKEAQLPDRINRVTTGTYELGSVFKAFNTAMALESGRFRMDSQLDARTSLYFGSQRIDDFHGKHRMLSLPEVFIFSSNVGSARMALALGGEHQREFLGKLGLLERLRTELPESAAPLFPHREWKPVETATIAFGHGITVAPLQALAGTAALMNGGFLVHPTFEKRTPTQARALATRVISQQTSDNLRYLFRLNVEKGSGRRADVDGFLVGGKTGTAEKVIDGHYAHSRLMSSFLAAFPTDRPQYVLLIMLDEPQRVAETGGNATAAVNAAPTTGRLIARIAPLLNIAPRIDRLAATEIVNPEAAHP